MSEKPGKKTQSNDHDVAAEARKLAEMLQTAHLERVRAHAEAYQSYGKELNDARSQLAESQQVVVAEARSKHEDAVKAAHQSVVEAAQQPQDAKSAANYEKAVGQYHAAIAAATCDADLATQLRDSAITHQRSVAEFGRVYCQKSESVEQAFRKKLQEAWASADLTNPYTLAVLKQASTWL